MTDVDLPRGGHCGVVVLVFVLDVGDHRDGLVVQLYEAPRELGVKPRWRRRLLHLKRYLIETSPLSCISLKAILHVLCD